MFPIKTTGVAAETDFEATIRAADGAHSKWRIPEETPVAFVYNRRNYAVMLATPNDLADFAVGFSLTERIIDRVDDIVSLDIVHGPLGVDLRFTIKDACLERFDVRGRRRNIAGASGCGVCGLENADELFTELPKVADEKLALKPEAMARALEALPNHQLLNQKTRSVHAAGWARLEGEIQDIREDVGRHNALDKLLGALALKCADTRDGFVVMSSRCSYELVAKAARRGVQAVLSVSGPTNFALKKAREANISLFATSATGVIELVYEGPRASDDD